MGAKDKVGHQKWMVFASLGFEVAGSIIVAAIVGVYLDNWLLTSPVLLILLVIGSFVAVFYRIIKILKRLERQEEDSSE